MSKSTEENQTTIVEESQTIVAEENQTTVAEENKTTQFPKKTKPLWLTQKPKWSP